MNARELIIGQDSALQVLEVASNSGRLGHCYVFAGPEGIGRRTTALALAKALQCEDRPSAGASGEVGLEFCGACAACRQIEAGCHPDVLVWADRPRVAWWSSGRGARLYAGPLAMEEARQLREEMSLTPALGSRRVFIIDRADQMDTEPANSLLKTLEEPPGERVLVLLAENSGRLLSTILSRAQRVRFGLVEEEMISRWLRGLFPGLEQGLVQRAVAFAGGRPGWAHLFALTPGILDVAERALEALIKVASSDPYAPFSAPTILESGAREWHRLAGEGMSSGEVPEAEEEGARVEVATSDSQVAREYLPLLFNAIISFLRQGTLREGKGTQWAKEFEGLYGLGPDFYAALLPIVENFLKRLAANVNISLLLQLVCLEIAASGQ